jgi:hypothetical protein
LLQTMLICFWSMASPPLQMNISFPLLNMRKAALAICWSHSALDRQVITFCC